MTIIPTKPIGSIPRPLWLIEAIAAANGDDPALDPLYEEAIRDTKYVHRPVEQAVISPSALSLMYPADEIPDCSREQFIDDLLREHETEVRNCLKKERMTSRETAFEKIQARVQGTQMASEILGAK